MLMHDRNCLLGAVLVLSAVATGFPAMAQTNILPVQEALISQVNRPYSDGIPSELYRDVEGTVVSLNGDQVTLKLGSGQESVYRIPESVQRRYRMAPGSEIVLTVRDTDNDVVDVGLPGQFALDP